MNIKRLFVLVLLLSSITIKGFAQIEVGTWREHFSYRKAISIADAGDKVYVASELGVFIYDKEEGSFETLSKLNGLSDTEIQTIAYNKEKAVLIIAYKNSNIDIVKDNTIYNISEIKRKQISNSKTINSISFYENNAFLSCGFGIVVLNMSKLEVADTFFIGENSSYININDVCVFRNNIYAATDEGLFIANYQNANLADYRNWNLNSSIPYNNSKFSDLVVFNNNLFAARESATNLSTVYKLNDNWESFKTNIYKIKNLTSSEDNLIIVAKNNSTSYDKMLNNIAEINNYSFDGQETTSYTDKTDAFYNNNTFYVSDERYGLVIGNADNQTFFYPNGPVSNKTAHCKSSDGKLITTNGNNRMKAWYSPEYNVFENEEWSVCAAPRDTAKNFYSIAINPNNKDEVFIGAFGYGVFEFENNEFTNAYNHLNSSLQAIPTYDYGYIRITALEFDNNNNLWVANQLVPEPISVKTKDNEWQSFNFNGLITQDAPIDILVTKDNNKWFLLGESDGILVLDDNDTPINKSDDQYKKIIPTESTGETISNTVTAIEQDKDGNIWVATDDGVAIYYNPENVFDNNFYADRIQLTSYGNDTTEQHLFTTDEVTDIEVDGANRKWIATKSSGVFLMSENGKEQIYNFNIYNSPLPSNSINDIAINHKSGEVFILTDKGIVSYRSDATKANENFGDVYVFPNPIRPDYSGVITVTGLADEVNVKFSDVSGNVVYETTALGGQAVWNGKTFDGRKVSSGIYFVFCTNKDGSKTQVAKLLLMN